MEQLSIPKEKEPLPLDVLDVYNLFINASFLIVHYHFA